MTKNDYIKLAQALKDSKPIDLSTVFVKDSPAVLVSNSEKLQWRNTVEIIAMTLQQDNPRFNRNRFLVACGYKN